MPSSKSGYVGSHPAWSDATDFARSSSVVVFYSGGASALSEWTDAVVVTVTQRRSLSVYSRKYTDANSSCRMAWQTLAADNNLRTPSATVAAITEAAEYLGVELDWNVVVEELEHLDWCTAAFAAQAHGLEVEDSTTENPAQGATARQLEDLLLRSEEWHPRIALTALQHLHDQCRRTPTSRSWHLTEQNLFGRPVARPDTSVPGSLIEPPAFDFLALTGLATEGALEDALHDEYNWRSMLSMCDGVEIEETHEIDELPGMSDQFFDVTITDPIALARCLRELVIKHQSVYFSCPLRPDIHD